MAIATPISLMVYHGPLTNRYILGVASGSPSILSPECIAKDFAQTSHFKVPGSDKIKEKCCLLKHRCPLQQSNQGAKVLSTSLRASSSWVMGDFAYSLHKYI